LCNILNEREIKPHKEPKLRNRLTLPPAVRRSNLRPAPLRAQPQIDDVESLEPEIVKVVMHPAD